jgi:E3 ubiquitin-protein ligase SHPRH
MDEVQLCGDSSSAANMVSLIPRKYSLAVSGTPAKTDIKDLMGSLRFLRVPVLPFDNRLWHRLQQSPMRPAFDGLFQTIAVRTTKKEVAGEFDIPRQTRLVVPIELSDIEMHYYNDTLERQRVILGLPADPSAPRPEGWYLDRSLFRSSLQNLRQICTHIQVGQMAGEHARLGRRPNRLRLGNELLGLGEVLKKMKEDNIAEMSIATRAQVGDSVEANEKTLTSIAKSNDSEISAHFGGRRSSRETCICLGGESP